MTKGNDCWHCSDIEYLSDICKKQLDVLRSSIEVYGDFYLICYNDNDRRPNIYYFVKDENSKIPNAYKINEKASRIQIKYCPECGKRIKRAKKNNS